MKARNAAPGVAVAAHPRNGEIKWNAADSNIPAANQRTGRGQEHVSVVLQRLLEKLAAKRRQF